MALSPSNVIRIGPQHGPQTAFASCEADLCIYGGSAYCGKTAALILDPLRAVSHPKFNGIFFRREMPQITAGGGPWDTSMEFYQHVGARPTVSKHLWRWPNGAKMKFSHLQLEGDKFSHHSAAYVYIAFDELDMFSESQFWYLWTRNRPPIGYTGRCWMRAGTNPNADSWLRELLDWWIGPDGYPIQERSGILRYFTRKDDKIKWVTKDWRDPDGNIPKSLTFIPGTIDDNEIGNDIDPTYRTNLYAQDLVTRERLLKGNWDITYSGGLFHPDWLQIVDETPRCPKYVRYWDLAATPQDEEGVRDPDWTAGVLVGEMDGDIYIIDVKKYQDNPAHVEKHIKEVADADGPGVTIAIEEEHGAAGKYVTDHYIRTVLKDYNVLADYVTGEKVERAKPWAALAEQGHVYLARAPWNRSFIAQAGSFPLAKRDQIDAVSGAVKMLQVTKLVWPIFKRTNEKVYGDFTIKWENYLHYGALIATEDMRICVLAAVWERTERKLYIYGELSAPHSSMRSIAQKIYVGMNMERYLVHGLYGNLRMFEEGKRTAAQVFNAEMAEVAQKKRPHYVQEPTDFDLMGSISLANIMWHRGEIAVQSACTECARQFSLWHIDDKKGKPVMRGYELCEALCLIISAVNRTDPIIKKKIWKDPTYKPVKQKQLMAQRKKFQSWQRG